MNVPESQTETKETKKAEAEKAIKEDEENESGKIKSRRDSHESNMCSLPSPITEKHLIEVENLKWSIEYEKKLHEQTSKLLEDKVSELMA